MLRSLTRSESNRLPASSPKRSGSIEGFGSSYSVLGSGAGSSPVVMITTVTSSPPVTFVSNSTTNNRTAHIPQQLQLNSQVVIANHSNQNHHHNGQGFGVDGGRSMESPPNSLSSSSVPTTPESQSSERLSSLSRSQPDLSKLEEDLLYFQQLQLNQRQEHQHHHHNLQHNFDLRADLNNTIYDNVPVNNHLPPTPPKSFVNVNCNVVNSQDNILRIENRTLRSQIEILKRKVAKFEKFESEIQKVYQAHEELMRSAEKKEKLERAVRYKLEIEVRRLQAQNKDLKEQNSAALATIASNHQQEFDNQYSVYSNLQAVEESKIRDEDNCEGQKRDLLIAQLLVNENKELRHDKEQQEYELQAQRVTLEEQRMHIEILDSALITAQNQVAQLEAQLRKAQAYAAVASHSKSNSLVSHQ